MCSLFGIIDYERVLTPRQRMKTLQVLSRECEVRGTDATGIAYMHSRKLQIQKAPLPARRMHWKFPQDVHILLGHTRMTTQGNELENYNNHPFASSNNEHPFALSHNGMLWNDKILRSDEHLPSTTIETDSFIAVQLIDKQGELSFDSIKYMAEKVRGSFCFSILDHENNTYLVKGDNPLAIYRFNGYYLYASTDSILKKAVRKLGLSRTPFEEVKLIEGDILKICYDGSRETQKFRTYQRYYSCSVPYTWRDMDYEDGFEDSYLDLIIENAKMFGYSVDDILMLLDCGYSEEEIEEFLYNPSIMRCLTSRGEMVLT